MYGSAPYGLLPYSAPVYYDAGGATAATQIKRFDGSAFSNKTIKRWNGSAFMDVTIKRWNGSAFVEL